MNSKSDTLNIIVGIFRDVRVRNPHCLHIYS